MHCIIFWEICLFKISVLCVFSSFQCIICYKGVLSSNFFEMYSSCQKHIWVLSNIETLAANLDAKKLFLTTMATKKWSKPGVQKITLNLRIMWKDVNEENGKKGKVVFTNDFISILNSNLLKQDLKKMY